MYSHLDKYNNYNYRTDKEITHLYYKMTDELFYRHMDYCKANSIEPKISEQWVDILIDSEDFLKIKEYSIVIKAIHLHPSHVCKSEYWQIVRQTKGYKDQKSYPIHKLMPQQLVR